MSLKFYHNPRCSKSRAAKALLDERGLNYDTVLYLDTPPDMDELSSLVKKLGVDTARDMMRKGEEAYKDLGLSTISDEQALIVAMSEHPRLIERPILVKGEQAAIGRPLENIIDLLK
ncbi:MAG: arsenate reductase (glutaredoxin) [Robiginitomaculum sp.]|nr:MAG: arsenate reductase (glutaredoxin) [Robiginitomaculum sp.]